MSKRRREKGVSQRNRQPRAPTPPAPKPKGGMLRLAGGVALIILLAIGAIGLMRHMKTSGAPARRPPARRAPGTVTFTKDIAPLVFANCAQCHRPGESGPFPLLTYQQVKKHAEDIATVTKSGFMPPWPPAAGFGEFAGERRLAEDQIALIQQWVADGTPEGAPGDLPPQPVWAQGWQLGKPDLVVQLHSAYVLPASGKDVYRNFVIPIPINRQRYVQAVELRPGNRSAHHAFLFFDRTRQSRRLDEQDAEPGFPGMSVPVSASMPPGQFVSWQPGKVVSRGTADSIWTLRTNTDLVLQMHMQTTGKPELIQPLVGFYFTETPPNPAVSKVPLNAYRIDIPAGATDYSVTDSFVLPVDAEITGVLPHAHYLGKEVEGFAVRPDGTQQWLLRITNWDFNWQGDYQLREPVPVPKGSTLTMRWIYDNSTNNVRNPNYPPVPVAYGVNTTNEMGELSFRMRLKDTNDLARLEDALVPKIREDAIEFNTWRLQQNPKDAVAHSRLGRALVWMPGREAEAFQHLQTAIDLQPDLDEAHYALGLILQDQGQLARARAEFEKVIALNPDDSQAHGSLGFLLARLGFLDRSEAELRAALQLNPEDAQVRAGLAELMAVKEKLRTPATSGRLN